MQVLCGLQVLFLLFNCQTPELMYAGLSVSDCSSGLAGVAREQQGDYFSRLFHIKKTDVM